MSKRLAAAALVASAVFSWGCEPGSITEAEEQLGRGRGGEPRTLSFTIPALAETLVVDSILKDLAGDVQFERLPSGLLSYTVDPETLTVAVGEELKFENLGFDQFRFSFDQLLTTTEQTASLVLGFTLPGDDPTAGVAQLPVDTISFATEQGASVTGATVASGWVTRTVTNRSTCTGRVTMALLDAAGDTIVRFDEATIPAGGQVIDSVSLDGVMVGSSVMVGLGGVPTTICPVGPGQEVAAGVTFRPLTLASVSLDNVNETFTETFDALASETRLQAVDTVVVETGSFTVTAWNKLPIGLTVDLSLAGTRTPAGQPVAGTLAIPGASGAGDSVMGQLELDMNGVSIAPGSVVATANGAAVASSATIMAAAAADAFVVGATGSLEIAELRGTLDPVATPELNITVEEHTTLDIGTIDLGDFEDVVRDASLNTVALELVVDNGADVPLDLKDLQFGVVRIDPATGLPKRDPGTNEYVFEENASGQPALIDTSFSILRSGQTTVVLENQATVDMVNILVDLLLDDVAIAVVGRGTAVVGDGSVASIARGDEISMRVGMSFGVDFTLPAGGVTFDNTTVQAGLDMDTTDANDIAALIDTASVVLLVENGTPFAVQAVLAFIADSVDGDVFSMPGAILLDTITVQAPAVDASGFVVGPTADTVTVSLTGQQARVLLGAQFTASVRVTLKPPTGGRGAVRGSDQVIVDGKASVQLRLGGN